jgi:hypothetical protein
LVGKEKEKTMHLILERKKEAFFLTTETTKNYTIKNFFFYDMALKRGKNFLGHIQLVKTTGLQY